MSRRPVAKTRRVVVKVGSSSLGKNGLDQSAVDRTIDQVESAWAMGHPTVLVSSGAVAAGISSLGMKTRPTDVVGLQVAAAVGQGLLMGAYADGFRARGRVVGQVLLTKAILSERDQYLHARRALDRMLGLGVVPIVNENDTVAVEELRLGDNDRLAAIVCNLVDAGLLVLLTDTAGLLSADPRQDEGAELVEIVAHNDADLDRLVHGGKGPLGSGGVTTKIIAARMAAFSGIPTVIGPADNPGAVSMAVAGEDIGTWVRPRPQRMPARKLWIAFGQPAAGTVVVDAGARHALVEDRRSLLPVGVSSVSGSFAPGEAVEVHDQSGALIAKGLVRLSSSELNAVIGRRSEVGELINRDDLVVLVDGD